MRDAIRSAVKTVAIAAMGSTPAIAAKLWSIRRSDALVIPNLHRVGPPDGSTYPPLASQLFEELIRFARRHFDLVTFADLARPRSDSRPRMILSFDDGYADFATHAAPILEKHDVRANLNIIPECIETGQPPLNVIMQDFAGKAPLEALCRLEVPGLDLDPRLVPRSVIGQRLSNHIVGLPIAAQRSLADHLWPQIRRAAGFSPTAMLRLDQLRQIAERHEIGAHSFSHASMALESDDYLRDDIGKCRTWFAEHLGREPATYAFPNGSVRPGQVELARSEGLSPVLLVGEDFSAAGAPAHKRFTFHAYSRAEVRVRATGAWRWPAN